MSAEYVHRILWSVQTRGACGKSTVAAVLGQFLDENAVPWRGFDLDPDHRNFVRLYPENVQCCELGNEPEADVIRVIRRCTDTPVSIIDPRAHLSEVILRAWEMVRFQETIAKSGGRVTVLVYPSDDLEVMTDIDSTVSRLQQSVDYIVVKNRGRAMRTRMYDGSALQADLGRLNASEVEVPALLSFARNQIAALEAELGRGISHIEAAKNSDLHVDSMVRLVVEDWLRGAFRELRRARAKIVPTAFVAPSDTVDRDITSERGQRANRGAKINRKDL